MAKLRFERVRITPAKAKKMLGVTENSDFVNRSAKKSVVQRYVNDIRKGHWQTDTGEVIKVTKDGLVIDGQHRLTAIIIADQPVTIWVCYDIAREMFQYIDQGTPRDLHDIMHIEGWKNPTEIAVVGKMIWRNQLGGSPYAHAGAFNESDGNVYDWLAKNEPDLQEVWNEYHPLAVKVHRNMGKAMPVSLIFYLLYQKLYVDQDLALLFFTYMSEVGESPAHKAMAFFQKYAEEQHRLYKDGKLSIAGRHGDLKESLVEAFEYAWSLVENNKRSVSFDGFKRGLGQYKAAQKKAA